MSDFSRNGYTPRPRIMPPPRPRLSVMPFSHTPAERTEPTPQPPLTQFEPKPERPAEPIPIKKPVPSPKDPASDKQKSSEKPADKIVEIKLSLPSLPKLPKIKLPKTQLKKAATKIRGIKITRKKVAAAGVLCLAAAVAVGSYYLLTQRHNKLIGNEVLATSTTQSLVHGTPTYHTIVPADKSIEQLGGWTRVSPPDRNPVFAYVDKIGETQINVSEQPLPEDFKTDTQEQVLELAQGYHANQKTTVGSINVYIGTSAKGPQSVIFVKGDVLVLIKSVTKIENNDWVKYVSSLQ